MARLRRLYFFSPFQFPSLHAGYKVSRPSQRDIYVDDINMGGSNVEEVKEMKEAAVDIFKAGGFELHKWHSNETQLVGDAINDDEPTFAKESLGTKPSETKLLGKGWDKVSDNLSITFPESEPAVQNVLCCAPWQRYMIRWALYHLYC